MISGTGAHTLFLHGVGLRAEAWGAQLDALPGRLIATDMPGHGQSAMPDAEMVMEDYVSHFEQVVLELAAPCILVGHSMGAMIALALASRLPDRVEGVAALNAVFERSAEASDAVIARAAALDGTSPADPAPTLARWFSDMPSPERVACDDWLRSMEPAAYRSAYKAFAYSEIPDRAMLSGLSCAALFMTGALDANSTPDMSQRMARLTPQGHAHVVEGAAHMMPMTHATEVTRQLAQFIETIRS